MSFFVTQWPCCVAINVSSTMAMKNKVSLWIFGGFVHSQLGTVSDECIVHDSVTIYSSGSIPAGSSVQKVLYTVISSGIKLDQRPIRQPIDREDTVGIEFEDNQNATLGMLLHKPPTTNAGLKRE